MTRLAVWSVFSVLALGNVGCEPAQVKKCHADMQASQQVMLAMDNKDEGSVKEALAQVQAAHASCQAAGRSDEVSSIANAKRSLEAHVAELAKRAAAPKREALTPEELAKLAKDGDDSCPRGQAYEHGASKQIIKCTGPLLAEMPWKSAQDYYEKRGYNLMMKKDAPVFRAEYGAESYTLTYDKIESTLPPKCMEIVPRPGVPWEETVARVTAVHPSKLKLGEPIPFGGGKVMKLRVTGDSAQWSLAIGECGDAPPAEKPGAPGAAGEGLAAASEGGGDSPKEPAPAH